jgi:hypothetical protein
LKDFSSQRVVECTTLGIWPGTHPFTQKGDGIGG